jgi:hypothetical protein
MGVKMKTFRLLIMMLLITQTLNAIGNRETNAPPNGITQEELAIARNQLKAYGFAICMTYGVKDMKSDSKERGIVYDDIEKMRYFYFFMNRGVYSEYFKEYTFETIWDPYRETEKYVKRVYDSFQKHYIPITSGCLDIYNSKGFNAFIKQQDWLIDLDTLRLGI